MIGNSKIIITMGGMAIGSCLVEKLCSALGKQDIAQSVSVVTVSLMGSTVAVTASKLLQTVSNCMK